MIVIVDYGAGNLQSVKNALDKLGIPSLITDDQAAILNATHVIFPGQGHFGACIYALREKGLFEVIQEAALTKHFFGICVGMQLLFEKSEEAPGVLGLGILKGEVRKFPENYKLPQMGWKKIQSLDPNSNEQFFYFAHSYYCLPEDPLIVTGATMDTEPFACIVEKGNLFSVQFHPEKSSSQGLVLFEKFAGRQKC